MPAPPTVMLLYSLASASWNPSSATREKTKSRRSTCAYPSIIRLLLLHKWSDHSSRSPFFLLRFPSTSCCCCCCCYCYCQYIHLTVNFISFSIQSTTGTYEMLIFRDQSLGMAGIMIMIMLITYALYQNHQKLRSIKIKSETQKN
jgi:hypothetical protein